MTDELACAEVKPKGAPAYDFRDETLYWEGPPHRGDLAINIALGTTLLWLPLTFAALGRGIFVNYRFTDRRLSVSTTAPWKSAHSRLPSHIHAIGVMLAAVQIVMSRQHHYNVLKTSCEQNQTAYVPIPFSFNRENPVHLQGACLSTCQLSTYAPVIMRTCLQHRPCHMCEWHRCDVMQYLRSRVVGRGVPGDQGCEDSWAGAGLLGRHGRHSAQRRQDRA